MKSRYADAAVLHAMDQLVLWVWNRWGWPRIDQLRFVLVGWAVSTLAADLMAPPLSLMRLAIVAISVWNFGVDERLARLPAELQNARLLTIRAHPMIVGIRCVFYALLLFASAVFTVDFVRASGWWGRLAAGLEIGQALLFAMMMVGAHTLTPSGPRNRRRKRSRPPARPAMASQS